MSFDKDTYRTPLWFFRWQAQEEITGVEAPLRRFFLPYSPK